MSSQSSDSDDCSGDPVVERFAMLLMYSKTIYMEDEPSVYHILTALALYRFLTDPCNDALKYDIIDLTDTIFCIFIESIKSVWQHKNVQFFLPSLI